MLLTLRLEESIKSRSRLIIGCGTACELFRRSDRWNDENAAARVVYEMVEEFIESVQRLDGLMND